MDLFNVLLTEFPGLYWLCNLYRGSGIGGNAWKKIGSAGKENRMGYCLFSAVDHDKKFLVVTKLVLSSCRDMALRPDVHTTRPGHARPGSELDRRALSRQRILEHGIFHVVTL